MTAMNQKMGGKDWEHSVVLPHEMICYINKKWTLSTLGNWYARKEIKMES